MGDEVVKIKAKLFRDGNVFVIDVMITTPTKQVKEGYVDFHYFDGDARFLGYSAFSDSGNIFKHIVSVKDTW